ncbi:hypothetical protein M0R45_020389 [Rubus argutus]|uniref:Uncharacterized protein n=1 Tax=Rubus argutus TaxID=59490 RepID=A0AAW1X8R1_RUBAR
MDDQRRWEELDVDCLVSIFGRVGMESLLLDVPFVCKSWYKATLNPSCWQSLIFPELTTDPFGFNLEDTFIERFVNEYRLDESRFSATAFIKFVISRSKGKATALRLSRCASEDALKYAADDCHLFSWVSCPNGSGIAPRFSENKSSIIQEVIGKWTHLEWLVLGSSYNLENFLGQICIHCKDLSRLSVANAYIGKDTAVAIVSSLPKLKQLILKKANIGRDDLVTLLQGCKELVHLDVSDCIGFNEEDEEISKLASHIANFSSKGSTLFDYDDDDFDGTFYLDEVVYDGYGSN